MENFNKPLAAVVALVAVTCLAIAGLLTVVVYQAAARRGAGGRYKRRRLRDCSRGGCRARRRGTAVVGSR